VPEGPLFLLFPVATFVISMVAFMLFAGPLTWIAIADPAPLKRYRIQSRLNKQASMLWPSIKSWLVNNAAMFAGVVVSWPLLRLGGIHAGPLPAWHVMLLQLLFFIYLDDFLYYWMHRAMHGRWLYRHIHSWHHRIVTPWAVTGHYMHPVEYVVTGSVALLGPLLVGAHVVTVWLWFAFRQWEAAEGHCGYDFPWTPTHFLPFNDGARHHDAHHARVKGNYAGFLTHVDRLCHTFVPGYAESLAARRGVTS
jgi:4-alpha-methyl-delta7-sterol-4alpha-methyl oxidase